jgi:hypothetical protein
LKTSSNSTNSQNLPPPISQNPSNSALLFLSPENQNQHFVPGQRSDHTSHPPPQKQVYIPGQQPDSTSNQPQNQKQYFVPGQQFDNASNQPQNQKQYIIPGQQSENIFNSPSPQKQVFIPGQQSDHISDPLAPQKHVFIPGQQSDKASNPSQSQYFTPGFQSSNSSPNAYQPEKSFTPPFPNSVEILKPQSSVQQNNFNQEFKFSAPPLFAAPPLTPNFKPISPPFEGTAPPFQRLIPSKSDFSLGHPPGFQPNSSSNEPHLLKSQSQPSLTVKHPCCSKDQDQFMFLVLVETIFLPQSMIQTP